MTMDEKTRSRANAMGARLLQAFEAELVSFLKKPSWVSGEEAVDLLAVPANEVDELLSNASMAAGVFPSYYAGAPLPGQVKLGEEETGVVGRVVMGYLNSCEVVVFLEGATTRESLGRKGIIKEGQGRRVRAETQPVEGRLYVADSLTFAAMLTRAAMLGCGAALVDFLRYVATDGEKAAAIRVELAAEAAMVAAGVRPFGQPGPVLIEGGAP